MTAAPHDGARADKRKTYEVGDVSALAKVIWHASRADESTISATGANHVADAVIASDWLAEVEQRAYLAGKANGERAARERIAQAIEAEPWERWSNEGPPSDDADDQRIWVHGVGCGVRFAARIARGGTR